MQQNKWFIEEDNKELRFGYATENKIFSAESEFQKIEIFETKAYGRMLVIDGCVMTTEKDEFVYHEMISHIPTCYHKDPKSVLVIGGGDGGTVRELVKHECFEEITLCEIDGMVVDVSKEFFPTIAKELNHPKVKVCIEDGIKFIQENKNSYDIIIIDSTDPIGPGEGLFTNDFYKDVKAALKTDGLVCIQSESPWYKKEFLQKITSNLSSAFKTIRPYVGSVATYPRGLWSWTLATNSKQGLNFTEERFSKISKNLNYLTFTQAKYIFDIIPPFYRKKLNLK